MRVKGIDHVQLAMPAGEEAKARAFYQDLLGLPEVPKPPQLAARGGCWFGAGAEKIYLGVEDHFRPARKAHPALLWRRTFPLCGPFWLPLVITPRLASPWRAMCEPM
jgi:catechol 2,3-dioxygenase-like lactoylglutathione lyase family enzyme